MDIRQTSRYLGVPIGPKSLLCDDKGSVITTATLPHAASTKCPKILGREAIAAKIMAFYWIQSAYNLSDMLSIHWECTQ